MSNDVQSPIAHGPVIQFNPKGKLAAALSKAQKSLKSPTKGHKVDYKDKSGREIKYSYADLADCIEALKEPLTDNGLAYTQTLEYRKVGTTFLYGLVTTLMHESGEWTDSFHPLPEPGQARPQEFGSALTYARRYSVSAITGMASEEDDDGAMASKGLDTGKDKDADKSAAKANNSQAKTGQNKQNTSKDSQATAPKPEDYKMPVGAADVKGKRLGDLETAKLGQILVWVEGELTKKPEDKGFKIMKANVEMVIKAKSKGVTSDTSEPDLNDIFPNDEGESGPDIENHSQETAPKKPLPDDYVLVSGYGVDGVKGKALKSIAEAELKKVVKNIDLEMKKTPPPANVSGLFEVRSKIVEFLKSMDVKV